MKKKKKKQDKRKIYTVTVNVENKMELVLYGQATNPDDVFHQVYCDLKKNTSFNLDKVVMRITNEQPISPGF